MTNYVTSGGISGFLSDGFFGFLKPIQRSKIPTAPMIRLGHSVCDAAYLKLIGICPASMPPSTMANPRPKPMGGRKERTRTATAGTRGINIPKSGSFGFRQDVSKLPMAENSNSPPKIKPARLYLRTFFLFFESTASII